MDIHSNFKVMNTEKRSGYYLILGSMGVLIPYMILQQIFDYPNILRFDVKIVLEKFNQGGVKLIITWWAFALLGLPLIVAYIKIGQRLEQRILYLRWITTVGTLGLVLQMIGLLRWALVVPILSEHYMQGNAAVRASTAMQFRIMNQFLGVALGEHLGQLFTITWTVLFAHALLKLKLIAKWFAIMAFVTSAIYFLAQSELVATVIPGSPVAPYSGLVGSTLWIIWLFILGIKLAAGAISFKEIAPEIS